MYQEPIFRDLKIGEGRTPIAEQLQTQLMNFTTNQSCIEEIEKQSNAMLKTRDFFGDL